jgi:hypothetical protein
MPRTPSVTAYTVTGVGIAVGVCLKLLGQPFLVGLAGTLVAASATMPLLSFGWGSLSWRGDVSLTVPLDALSCDMAGTASAFVSTGFGQLRFRHPHG